MIKNIFLFACSVVIGALMVITGFLWASPRNSQVIKIILPQSAFSLEKAPTDSLSGKIASFSGKVAWQSRVAPVAILINSPVKLQQGEEIDTYDNGSAVIDFPKIGSATLSKNTQINLIQTLPQNFVVWQKQGSSVYSKNGQIPMNIAALDLLVNINSGETEISVDKDLFKISIIVKTGSIQAAFNDTDNNTNVVSVKEGQQYIFDNNAKTGIIKNL